MSGEVLRKEIAGKDAAREDRVNDEVVVKSRAPESIS